MPAPFFSIVLPVYNAAPYLGWAIASLLRQDHTHFEIIAIDDGSTDGSLEILERHAQLDPRIRIVSREHRGLISSLNQGLDLSRADFVARMDADDISYPGRLSLQAAAFEADPGLAVCGTAYDEIVGTRLLRRRDEEPLARYDLRILSLFFSPFAHSTIAFNRGIIAAQDLVYDPKYPSVEDFELIGRLATKYRLARIETSLLAYRLHAGSISFRRKRQQRSLHLGLVSENLRRDQGVESAALDELSAAALQGRFSPELAMHVADCLLEIDSAAERTGPGDRPSYRVGVMNLFHDLCCLFRDHDPTLLLIFLHKLDRWDWVRPMDRLWLAAYGRSHILGRAARKAVELAETGARRIRSVSLAEVLPDVSAPPAVATAGERRVSAPR